MSSLTLQSKIKLRDGNEIPIVGFGTYELDGQEAYQAVTWALEAGYRHINGTKTSANADARSEISVRRLALPRAEIFYTTKLKNNAGVAATKRAIRQSLEKCGLGYIDLYLIHGPWGGPKARRDSWEAIVDAQKEGILKSIGISTFGVRHMRELLDSGLPVPSVHQIDLHPFMTRTEIVKFSREHGMTLEAWGSLARGMRMKHPSILALAAKYKKGPAHIFLRYSLQKGFVPLVKSASQSRIIDNTRIFDFELTAEEVARLDSLNENLVTDWDPTNCP